MKKHILGFAIFSLIVGSFVSVWALFGYFTQPIPVVPKVESDRLQVFKSEKRKSCNMKRDKISYEVIKPSYYFADEKVIISTIKLKWNGYGSPPEVVSLIPKISTANHDTTDFVPASEKTLRDVFTDQREVTLTLKTYPKNTSDKLLSNNFYLDFKITTDEGLDNYSFENPHQIIVVHGEGSIRRTDIIKP
ncbi:hypothetical protein BH20ACI4_BH20ACI4_04920 [soil metagenome]